MRKHPYSLLMRLAISAGTASLCAGSAMAQTTVPSVDPSITERRFETAPTPPRAQEPLVGVRGAQKPPANADDVKMTLKSVNVDGSSVYSEEELAQHYKHLVGQQITLRQAYAIAQEINDQYLKDGYILSHALLETPVNGGNIRIRVVEGYISGVLVQTVEDEDATPLKDTRELLATYANRISQEKPLNSKTLERYLLLADDLPGVTAKAVIQPGENGANQLVMLIGFDRIEGSYGFNNRGTQLQGRNQQQAVITGNSLLGLFDRTSLRVVNSFPISELFFMDLQHEQQLGTDGAKLRFLASYTESEPGDILSPLAIESDATRFMISVEYPVIRSRKENLYGRFEVSARDSQTDLLGTDFTDDSLRVVRAGVTYDIADKLDGVNLIDFEISQGLDLFGATDAGTGRSRADGEADFTKVNTNLARLQDLPGNFGLLLQAAGQYSFDPLLAAEEFLVGGSEFGRAYDPAEIASDHGMAGKLELQYSDAAPAGSYLLQSYQLFTYYEAGAVWNESSSLVTNDSRQSLTAAGLGVRANWDNGFSSNMEFGFPLTRQVTIEGNKDPRFFFNLTKRF